MASPEPAGTLVHFSRLPAIRQVQSRNDPAMPSYRMRELQPFAGRCVAQPRVPAAPDLLRSLLNDGLDIFACEPVEASLEALFLDLVKESADGARS